MKKKLHPSLNLTARLIALTFLFNLNLQAQHPPQFMGMTPEGGSNSCGVVFTCNLNGSSYTSTSLKGNSSPNGAKPFGSFIHAGVNKFYGLITRDTLAGSDSQGGNGYLVQYNPVNGNISYLFHFTGTSGAYKGAKPHGSLLETGGKLYGMTRNGGVNDAGVIFSYDTAGAGTYTVLYEFSNSTGNDGYYPYGSLFMASDGNLYGMSSAGGSNNVGTIFSISTTGTFTKLVDFSGNSGTEMGGEPRGSLIEPQAGKLYGVTKSGGPSNQGVIFEFDISSSAYTVKYSFTAALSGIIKPNGSLLKALNGKLYGLCPQGGDFNSGGVFEYDLAGTGTYTKKLSFVGSDGNYALGSFIQASDTNLYAMTNLGHANNAGGITRYNYTSNSASSVLSFNWNLSPAGSSPVGDLLEYVSCVPVTPGAISGNTTICDTIGVYAWYVNPVPGATTYNWTTPSGWLWFTTAPYSLSASPDTTSGFFTVSASNSCGTSAASTLYVTYSNPGPASVSIAELLSPPSNVATGGTASSLTNNAGNFPQDAFDGDTINTGWGSDGSTSSSWLEYDFGSGNEKIINQYSFFCSTNMIGGWGWIGYMPQYWTFEGFNGTTWDTLDTQILSTPVLDTWYTYNFSNANPYQKYRMHFDLTFTVAYVFVTELRLYELASACSNRIFNASPGLISSPANYQWQVNGVNVGTNSSSYTLPYPVVNDTITCTIVTTNTCSTTSSANSNQIVLSTGNVTGSIVDTTICSGETITINSVTYNVSGTYYTDTLVAASGCDSLAVLKLTVDACLGNHLWQTENELSVYPNPNNGSFTVKTSRAGLYSIVNELGQTLQTIKLNAANNYSMVVSDVPAGIYFVLCPENGSRQKIVVTK